MHVDCARANLYTVANADAYSNIHPRFGIQSNASLCANIHTYTTTGARPDEPRFFRHAR
jgi:hypothetical protein